MMDFDIFFNANPEVGANQKNAMLSQENILKL